MPASVSHDASHWKGENIVFNLSLQLKANVLASQAHRFFISSSIFVMQHLHCTPITHRRVSILLNTAVLAIGKPARHGQADRQLIGSGRK